MSRFFLIICFLLVSITARAQDLTVFAAASLTDAMKDIAAQWVAAGHKEPRLSFGASSTLARQIEQGAPANVFASADQKWMDYLAEKNLIAAGTRTNLLENELVLIAPADRHLSVTIKPGMDLVALLGSNGRIATGDPAHVPVGLYAKQALTRLGLWDKVEPRLARADDVRSALLLVERGEAPLGIVYATDAKVSKAVAVAGVFPADTHDPVTYPFAVTKAGDTPDARAFLKFLSGPKATAIFADRGFKVMQ
ncbi:molybdate ABC transporter substrate-binding protein [Rhodopila sp.]|uniref:molybdate ABC transporter substrate-binding protein n=1 Tax=Rhodopila sp. TaxID=2480087 RepID=UPI002B7F2CBC|nr:molybdate ABC transporter substrate-binding protein [Rhodopila sp.]HVZ10674.1 molybdate ABC transporter substrate-binding protein [Rhodopila sp.]